MREVKIHFHPNAWDQLMWFTKNDRKALSKIFEIIDSICKTPFEGIRKPEALKGDLSGYWSRRITAEHRIVYKTDNNSVFIFQVKGHYFDK